MRKIKLITLMSLMMLLMAGIVYGWGGGTVKIYVPPVIRTPTNTVNISISSGNGNVTNCTIERYSTLAEAASWTVAATNTSAIFNSTNCEAEADVACASASNATVQLTAYNISSGDSTDWQFRGRCNNVSNSTDYTDYSTTVSSITVDYGKPSLTGASPADLSQDVDGTITFQYTCTNATSADLYVELGRFNREAMDETSDVCSKELVISENGFHSWYVVASDGLNTTTSATITVEVRKAGGYIYDEQGNILVDTAGSTVPLTGGNAVTNIVNSIFNTIFGIFESIFSVFQRG